MMLCRTLGPVELSLDGGPAPAELMWRKHLALLVYLARSSRGRSRESLVGLLWAERPEAAARHSLNEALRVLRRYLGDESVRTAGGSVRLAPGAVRLDLDQLEAAAGQGDWGAAAGLVAGEFLEGFAVPGASEFEDWLAEERGIWRRRSVEVLLHHADELLRSGQARDAADVALRATALDPRSEHAVRAAVRSLALTGERAAALAQYEDFARRIADEMAAQPEVETRALAERVRRERLDRPAAPPGADQTPVERLPLAGRETELRQLLGAAEASRVGRSAGAVVIDGESGMGKTRLLEELLARLRLDGMTVAAARAVEGDRAEPWSGILALARGGLLEAPGLSAAPPQALGSFAAEIEEWADRFPAVGDGGAVRSLGRAVSDVLRATAEDHPIVLALDDAQWLDRESAQALAGALRDLPAAPVLLVLALAPDPPHPDLDDLRSRIGRDLPGVTLRIGPLGPAPLRSLARRLLPAFNEVETDRVVRRVGADSAGVPLLAVELLRAVALGLDLGAIQGSWPEPLKTLDQSLPGDLPDTIVASIRIGFRRLSPEAQRVLAASSVLGDRVSASSLVAALDLPTGVVNQALDELEWHRWLVSEPRGYGFVARLVRQVIERDMLTPGQRRRVLDAVAATEMRHPPQA